MENYTKVFTNVEYIFPEPYLWDQTRCYLEGPCYDTLTGSLVRIKLLVLLTAH